MNISELLEKLLKKESDDSDEDFATKGEILKVDHEERIVFGWASVISEKGKTVVDSQGDMIREDVLAKAARQFVLDERAGKVMHMGKRVADVVESIVFTEELQKILGIDLGKVGWFVAFKIRDEKVWKKVKSGELSMFSIGGTGVRVNA